MKIYLFFILIVLSIIAEGHDLLEGFFKLSRPCFPVYQLDSCNRTLWEVYTPTYKGTDINIPTTRIYLFTPKNPGTAEQLHECAGALPTNSTFDSNVPTEVIVHGFLDGVCRTAWMREMKEQLMKRGEFNIILIDWTWGNNLDYTDGARNTIVVGQQLAYVLTEIMRLKKYSSRNFHIIGHSFGGTIAATTGRILKNKSKLGRITALDYAYDPIDLGPLGGHLDSTDAYFVDAIHSNGGECFPLEIGDRRQVGHVDFYVNGGTYQLSCIPYILTSLLKLDVFYAVVSLLPNFCFHLQSLQYFKLSIDAEHLNSSQFIGVECDTKQDFLRGTCSRNCTEGPMKCLVMGMDTPLYYDDSDNKNRVYYVPTKLNCPYVDYSNFIGLPLPKIGAKEVTT